MLHLLDLLLQHWRLTACAAALILVKLMSARTRRQRLQALQAAKRPAGCGGFTLGTLDLRRKAQIATARATDHAGEATLVPNFSFDLDQTIFASVKGKLKRTLLERKLAVFPHWSDLAVDRIEQLASKKLPSIKPMSTPVINFMRDECNFVCEHADGSFMDHLRFCHDYSALNFKGHSPRVLLLHSILGVATNIFPMDIKLLPKLEQLVDPVEMLHISAFPSVQRTLLNGTLIPALEASGKIKQLKQVTMRRVIDNEPFTLDQEEFWVHMNYQLVHLLDFLPTIDWDENLHDPQIQLFAQVLRFLKEQGKLFVALDADEIGSRTLYGQIQNFLYKKAINQYSAQIGHSVEFDLKFA